MEYSNKKLLKFVHYLILIFSVINNRKSISKVSFRGTLVVLFRLKIMYGKKYNFQFLQQKKAFIVKISFIMQNKSN